MNKILLIEDDQIVGNVYRNKLVLEGFEVEIAYDGETGLELLHSFHPDALIVDLILPKLQGVDVIRHVRRDPEFQKVPVIVFTNTYLTSIVQDAWKAGATKCLAKSSCSPKQVIGTLRSVLETGGAVAPKAVNAPAAKAPETPRDPDADFQAGLRRTFIDGWPATFAGIRGQLQAMTRTDSSETRLNHIHDLYRRIHAVTGSAGITRMTQLAQMTDALEALLKELHEKPKNINVSSLRTVASAVDSLGPLFEQSRTPGKEPPTAKVLVIEDDEISRRAIIYALEKARLRSVTVEDPLRALELVLETRFDLVFLDVCLPNMSGYEFCAKLRTLPDYKNTPVVFITGLTDFESRANSTMSGGNDIIGKPFMFVELAVKALVHALRGRMQAGKG
jgi:DNA-binding response OmpR family regulator